MFNLLILNLNPLNDRVERVKNIYSDKAGSLKQLL